MTCLSAPILDVSTGVMATVLPSFTPPVFLRLAAEAGGEVDRARQAYLRAANAELRTCVAGWRDGAGVLVHGAPASVAALTAEVHEVGRTLRALGDPAVAEGYLETMAFAGGDDASGANPNEGE
jgi:hypothetical protein